MLARPLQPQDRSRIGELVVSTGSFNDEEIKTALELVDEALAGGEKSGYLFIVIEDGAGPAAEVQGYACYGPAPLADGVYDLYWIVVHRAAHGRGYGRRLLELVEGDICRRRGRKLLIETSSQESYAATIRFYERSGYALAARIRDFYKVGDDKLVYAKDFT